MRRTRRLHPVRSVVRRRYVSGRGSGVAAYPGGVDSCALDGGVEAELTDGVGVHRPSPSFDPMGTSLRRQQSYYTVVICHNTKSDATRDLANGYSARKVSARTAGADVDGRVRSVA